MRHVSIRGILTVLWLAAAVVSGRAGNCQAAALYAILGCLFLYSAYTTWKKAKADSRNGI